MIRALTLDELAGYCPRLLTESDQLKRRSTVSPEKFFEKWDRVYRVGTGVVLGYWVNGHLVGSLGAIVSEDLYSDVRMAYELFWNVRKEARGVPGWRGLFPAYVEWATNQGAVSAYLTHWADYPQISALFGKFGFRHAESLYRKDL